MSRLANIPVETLVDEVTSSVESQVKELAGAIGYTVMPRKGETSELRIAVRLITRYAQTGENPWGKISAMRDAIILVNSSLYGWADNPRRAPHLDGPREPPQEDIELVLKTAWARQEIEEGHPMVPLGLACIAGITRRQVDRLIEAGEIKEMGLTGMFVTPKEAKRWLASRDVAGYVASEERRS